MSFSTSMKKLTSNYESSKKQSTEITELKRKMSDLIRTHNIMKDEMVRKFEAEKKQLKVKHDEEISVLRKQLTGGIKKEHVAQLSGIDRRSKKNRPRSAVVVQGNRGKTRVLNLRRKRRKIPKKNVVNPQEPYANHLPIDNDEDLKPSENVVASLIEADDPSQAEEKRLQILIAHDCQLEKDKHFEYTKTLADYLFKSQDVIQGGHDFSKFSVCEYSPNLLASNPSAEFEVLLYFLMDTGRNYDVTNTGLFRKLKDRCKQAFIIICRGKIRFGSVEKVSETENVACYNFLMAGCKIQENEHNLEVLRRIYSQLPDHPTFN